MGIYVEIFVRTSMDELWRHTQDPALHQRWDLRFSTIRYLPRATELEPQRFEYSTRIGFGIQIAGTGESMGSRNLQNGERASSLKFFSAHPLSLIREGSGYWKYVPESGGVRFITWYDYRPRFGILGKIIDRLAFRPLMAWATAWSFDRLRRWLECGEEPAAARTLALTHAISRATLAAIFAWHGLVPKLWFRDPDEIAMLRDGGITAERVPAMLCALGVAEILFAVVLLVFRRHAWPAWSLIGLMAIVSIGNAMVSPRYITAAFNPVSLNLSVAAFALIDALSLSRTPSSANCNWSSMRGAS